MYIENYFVIVCILAVVLFNNARLSGVSSREIEKFLR